MAKARGRMKKKFNRVSLKTCISESLSMKTFPPSSWLLANSRFQDNFMQVNDNKSILFRLFRNLRNNSSTVGKTIVNQLIRSIAFIALYSSAI